MLQRRCSSVLFHYFLLLLYSVLFAKQNVYCSYQNCLIFKNHEYEKFLYRDSITGNVYAFTFTSFDIHT